MDLSALGSNSDNSIFDVLKQRREAMQAMEAAVQCGDIQTAQQNLATVQQNTQGIQAATGNSNTQQNPYQSTLKTDLSNLINAVQGGNIGTAQSTLQTLQQDSQAIADPGPNNVASNQPNSPFLNDLTNLLNSVVLGDSTGVQTAATALQQDLQAVFGTTPPPSTQTTSASTTSDRSQNSFVNDLQALISAAGANDATGMQTAAKNLAQDIQSAVDGAASDQVAGHHHHHHQSAAAANAATTTIAATGSTGTTAQGNIASQGTQTPGKSSGSAVSSALKNAQDAYELLMSFSEQTTKAA